MRLRRATVRRRAASNTYKDILGGYAKTKYKSVGTTEDGIKFASKKEVARYRVLKLEQKAGEIRGLRTHVRYPIVVNGVQVCEYECDFEYERMNGNYGDGVMRPLWKKVVEDVKGYRTDVYKLKKKLMRAALGIEVVET